MNHNIYSVFDSKAEMYTLPFYQTNDSMALRLFSDWCNNPEHTFGKHPEDYTLFKIGYYEDNTGSITQDKIESITNGLQTKGQNQ